jgi:hypothetical protein
MSFLDHSNLRDLALGMVSPSSALSLVVFVNAMIAWIVHYSALDGHQGTILEIVLVNFARGP